MIVVGCGSRNWTDERPIRAWLSWTSEIEAIYTGGADGADEAIERVARGLGIHTFSAPALWPKYGNSAGPIRNAVVLREAVRGAERVVVLAFRSSGTSPGTEDMLARARKLGLEMHVFTHEDGWVVTEAVPGH